MIVEAADGDREDAVLLGNADREGPEAGLEFGRDDSGAVFVLKMQWTRLATKESGMGATIAC